jgi:hypothetical protein
MPSPNTGRKLTFLGNPSILIRPWRLKISFRINQGKKQIQTLRRPKLRKESKKRKGKEAYFVGTVVVIVSSLIQITTGFSAWSEKYASTKDVIMRGLWALRDEECALLTSDSD